MVEDCANLLRPQQLRAMRQQQLIDMGGDDRAGIHCKKTFGNCVVALAFLDPQCGAAKAGIDSRLALDGMACDHIA